MSVPIGTLLLFFGASIPLGFVDGMKTQLYREPCEQFLYSTGAANSGPPVARCIVRVDEI